MENGVAEAPAAPRGGRIDDAFIVTAFVVCDKTMRALGRRDAYRAGRAAAL
ncbi:MAG TPA: hypothetical protein VFW96_18900 [Thermomicrobiales bacterium]|nr:hypothetical protein [Thermomicrobiales bacterium]